VDGAGEWATTTYGRGEGSSIDCFEEVQYPDSLGLLYSTVTTYLGFAANDGEYKVMGLAPYGEPAHADRIGQLVRTEPGGGFRLDMKYFDFNRRDRMYSDALPDLLGAPPRTTGSEITQFHQDIARSLQAVLETILLEKVRYLHARTGSANLCMAGGVALNCVANSRILRDGPFTQLFIQPAAGDNGGAVGAAADAFARRAGKSHVMPAMTHAYWGPAFSRAEVEELLTAASISAQDCQHRPDVLFDRVAERLAAGEIIGWFQGRMEYGPRALGSRSILADPRRADMRDRINALVKKREAFRPFAPAVLESRAAEHFELDHPTPFMLETCQVRSPIDLPAITHVDGSARVQTVNADTNPRFAGLLSAFDRLTGCPMLLNTSFNMRDEPIVCTPVDAVVCFVRSGMDVLVLEDFIIRREDLPPSWPILMQRLAAPQSGVSSLVYTLF
jgi:carbamoyltransferase